MIRATTDFTYARYLIKRNGRKVAQR